MEGNYDRDEYCATCHYQYDTAIEKHAKHKPGAVSCDDCHQTATTAGGTRYSVHDHKYDFSQPAPACAECHEEGDERLKRTPTHVWNLRPVKFPKPLTMEENCVRCHGDKDAAWIQEKLKTIRKRL